MSDEYCRNPMTGKVRHFKRGDLDEAQTVYALNKLQTKLNAAMDELPDWLIDDDHKCRAVKCFPECPAYDYACRLRADSVAGNELEAKNARLEARVKELEKSLWEHTCACCEKTFYGGKDETLCLECEKDKG